MPRFPLWDSPSPPCGPLDKTLAHPAVCGLAPLPLTASLPLFLTRHPSFRATMLLITAFGHAALAFPCMVDSYSAFQAQHKFLAGRSIFPEATRMSWMCCFFFLKVISHVNCLAPEHCLLLCVSCHLCDMHPSVPHACTATCYFHSSQRGGAASW